MLRLAECYTDFLMERSVTFECFVCASILTAEVHSLPPTFPVFFHFNALSFLELATTYLIYDGDTKSSSPLSELFRCS